MVHKLRAREIEHGQLDIAAGLSELGGEGVRSLVVADASFGDADIGDTGGCLFYLDGCRGCAVSEGHFHCGAFGVGVIGEIGDSMAIDLDSDRGVGVEGPDGVGP